MIFLFRLFILIFSVVGQAQELEEISAEDFLTKNPSPERKAIVNFIVHQFDSKRDVAITQTQLDDVWSNVAARNKLFMIRFQIVNQKLYADSCYLEHDHFIMLLRYLNNLVSKYKINDLDFIVYSGDDTNGKDLLSDIQQKLPTFLHSKDYNDPFEKDRFLFPDSYLITPHWNNLITRIENANNLYLWSNKIEKIFWIGKTTGNGDMKYNMDNFAKLPRLNLVILSKLYPDLINARFNSYYNFSDNKSGTDLKLTLDLLFGGISPSVSEENHLKYKYLISIDGNTCAWMRVPWIMLSNSVLVKQETSKMEWFYPAMKPYIHYIPVDESLTNIFQKFEWMKDHDNELKEISNNAQSFIKNNLMPEHIDAHSVIILNEYHNLHKDTKIIATLTSADELLMKINAWEESEAEKRMGIRKSLKIKFKKIFKNIVDKVRSLCS